MSRAQILLEKMVAAHIDAWGGAGKTTLMNKLKKEFPEFIFADLDDFKTMALNKLYKEKGSATFDEMRAQAKIEYEQWRKKQRKPIVLFGMGQSFDNIQVEDPSGKILLGVNSFKVAYRGHLRERQLNKELGNPPFSKTSELKYFLRSVLNSMRYKKELKFFGYKSVNPKKVKTRLKEIASRMPK
jgi:hypothetical protein